MNQTHNKFKLFVGTLAADRSLGSLAGEVEAFVSKSGVAPKSIGAEYLEHAGRLLVTIGYRDDEPGFPVRIRAVHIGQLGREPDLQDLEAAMSRAAAVEGAVICHELYVTADDQIYMIFMSRV